MDPNITWLNMVKTAAEIFELEDEQPDGFEDRMRDLSGTLATSVRAMDDWLRHGGALPAAWAGGRKETV